MKSDPARPETARSAKAGRDAKGLSVLPGGISEAKRARIVVVDDHPMTRAGVVQLINGQPDMQVRAEAGSPAQAFEATARELPDLLLTDMTMPGRSGVEFIKDILAVHPKLPILILSMHDETIYAERALRAGAKGYIMKEAGGDRLLAAIRRVLQGQVYVSEEVSAAIISNLSGSTSRKSHSPIEKLTDREFEVFRLIGFGKSTREIAKELHLSTKTVDVHRGHIKEKLELKDATSLVRHAVRWVETLPPTGI
jgi:DNA-binding NarL/FixJ family response regulator